MMGVQNLVHTCHMRPADHRLGQGSTADRSPFAYAAGRRAIR